MEHAELERAIVYLTFCARFLVHRNARSNYAYAELAHARHLQCREYMTIVSLEMANDVARIADDVQHERWASLVDPQ